MRFWFSMPFIRRTRIGVSVSDREIERAFHARPLTAAERDQRAQEEAELDARAQAIAKRWAVPYGRSLRCWDGGLLPQISHSLHLHRDGIERRQTQILRQCLHRPVLLFPRWL
jgi:hypothetical protein